MKEKYREVSRPIIDDDYNNDSSEYKAMTVKALDSSKITSLDDELTDNPKTSQDRPRFRGQGERNFLRLNTSLPSLTSRPGQDATSNGDFTRSASRLSSSIVIESPSMSYLHESKIPSNRRLRQGDSYVSSNWKGSLRKKSDNIRKIEAPSLQAIVSGLRQGRLNAKSQIFNIH